MILLSAVRRISFVGTEVRPLRILLSDSPCSIGVNCGRTRTVETLIKRWKWKKESIYSRSCFWWSVVAGGRGSQSPLLRRMGRMLRQVLQTWYVLPQVCRCRWMPGGRRRVPRRPLPVRCVGWWWMRQALCPHMARTVFLRRNSDRMRLSRRHSGKENWPRMGCRGMSMARKGRPAAGRVLSCRAVCR